MCGPICSLGLRRVSTPVTGSPDQIPNFRESPQISARARHNPKKSCLIIPMAQNRWRPSGRRVRPLLLFLPGQGRQNGRDAFSTRHLLEKQGILTCGNKRPVLTAEPRTNRFFKRPFLGVGTIKGDNGKRNANGVLCGKLTC